jgi:hypothetical protein
MDIEKLSVTVVFLRTEIIERTSFNNKTYEILLRDPETGDVQPKKSLDVATGLLVADNKILYLVTADHVAKKTSIDTEIIVKENRDIPYSFELTTLTGVTESPKWISHDTADIAVLKLEPDPSLKPILREHFLPLSFIQKELVLPDRAKPLIMLGFPPGLVVEEYFSPLSRVTKISSGLLTLNRFDTETPHVSFLLDNPGIGGYSGAPIFELPGTYLKGESIITSKTVSCIGFVHGTHGDKSGGEMAVITPAAKVVELIEQLRGR